MASQKTALKGGDRGGRAATPRPYRRTNGGGSWTRILGPEIEGRRIGIVDVVMDPTDTQTLYAASYDKVRLPFTFDLGGPGSRLSRVGKGR